MAAVNHLGAALLLAAACAYGQRAPSDAGKPGPARRPAAKRAAAKLSVPVRPPKTPLDWWNQTSPEQRERALAKLSPERQRTIRERIDHFNSLPQEEQSRLRARYQLFSHLSPEKQDLVRRQMRRFSQVAPDRKRVLARELQRLRRMPAKERRARFDSEEYRGSYSDDERQMMRDLSENYPSLPK